MIRPAVVFVVLLGVACAAAGDEKDPVKEKLSKAKAAHDTELQQFRKQADEWFDKREDDARNAGDRKVVDQVKEERKSFADTGELPKTAPNTLSQKPALAKKALESAFAEAVQAYTKANREDEAAVVLEEWQEFSSKATAKPAAIDLLALIDTKTHVIAGKWEKDGKSFLATSTGYPDLARLQLPYEPGEEYDIEATVRRGKGPDYFAFSLVAGGRRVHAAVDTWPSKNFLSGFSEIDGKSFTENGTGVTGQFLKPDADHTVRASVRSEKIELLVNGKVISSYNGDFKGFSVHSDFRVPNEKALAVQIGPGTSYRIDRIVVTPVKGKGKIVK